MINIFSKSLQVKYPSFHVTSKSRFSSRVSSLPKRYARFLFSTTFTIFLFLVILHQSFKNYELKSYLKHPTPYPDIPYPEIQLEPDNSQNLPPLFEAYQKYEDSVSEWNIEHYGNKNDRYLYIANHPVGVGWGNIMQEMVTSSLLASGSGRGFVWDDYTWNWDGSQYSYFKGKPIPSKVPLSTMVAGYILGLPTTASRDPRLPPSISFRAYERICPETERVYIDRDRVKEHLSLTDNYFDAQMPGSQVLDGWLSLLNSSEVREKKCVEVRVGTPQVFDIWILHTPRLHSMIPTLFSSPAVNDWGWSQLIKRLFKKNVHLFTSARLFLDSARAKRRFYLLSPKIDIDNVSIPSSLLDQTLTSTSSPLPLLVLHLRRGDYEEHCLHLAKYRSTYNGMFTLPEFEERDKFAVPKLVDGMSAKTTKSQDLEVFSEEEMTRFYLKHCYPNATQIQRKVREVLHDYENHLVSQHKGSRSASLAREKVRKVYIISNGDKTWLEETKKALLADVEKSRNVSETEWEFEWSWDAVTSSRDLVAGWEEKQVLQALDMYVAQRAELFVGNGFSTMSGNIVMFRKQHGFHPVQTRFW